MEKNGKPLLLILKEFQQKMTLLEEQLQTLRDPYEEFFNLTG